MRGGRDPLLIYEFCKRKELAKIAIYLHRNKHNLSFYCLLFATFAIALFLLVISGPVTLGTYPSHLDFCIFIYTRCIMITIQSNTVIVSYQGTHIHAFGTHSDYTVSYHVAVLILKVRVNNIISLPFTISFIYIIYMSIIIVINNLRSTLWFTRHIVSVDLKYAYACICTIKLHVKAGHLKRT